MNEYEIITSQFSKNIKEIERLVQSSKFPKTAKALFRFTIKIEMLSKAIGALGKAGNLYSSYILLRSQYEHLLVSHYIWMKYRQSKSDKCGKEYYIDYFVAEFLKREGFDLKVEGIKNNKKNNNNLENIKKKIDYLKDATQGDIDEIHRTGNQFDISRIGHYLVNTYPETDVFAAVHKSMLDFINKYNRLSSYVHGGPISEKEIFENFDKEMPQKEFKELEEWQKKCSVIPKEHLIYFLADEEVSIIRVLEPLRKFRKIK